MPIVPPNRLLRLCESIYEASGIPKEDAKTAASCIVKANLRGRDEYGLRIIPEHVSMIQAGTANPHPKVRTVSELESCATIDGDHGLGSIIATKAVSMAIQKARKSGASWVCTKNTNDFGMAANYAMLALEHDCIGIVMANTLPWVAPYGGRNRVLGTNPICFAIPASREVPIVFDAATSTVSLSKVQNALEKGEK